MRPSLILLLSLCALIAPAIARDDEDIDDNDIGPSDRSDRSERVDPHRATSPNPARNPFKSGGYNGKNRNMRIIYPTPSTYWLSGEDQVVKLCIRNLNKLPEIMHIAVHRKRSPRRPQLKWHTRMRKSHLIKSKDKSSDRRCQIYEFPLGMRGMPTVDGKHIIRVTRQGKTGQWTLAKSKSFYMIRLKAQPKVPSDLRVIESVLEPAERMQYRCSYVPLKLQFNNELPGDIKVRALNLQTMAREDVMTIDEDSKSVEQDRMLSQNIQIPFNKNGRYLFEFWSTSGKDRLLYRSEDFRCAVVAPAA